MLPYTPLHHLLLRAVGGMPLVMTSGNRSDEPIAYEDDEALERLAGIADLFLMHDRPIHVRCDDSVTRVVDGVGAAGAALARLRPAADRRCRSTARGRSWPSAASSRRRSPSAAAARRSSAITWATSIITTPTGRSRRTSLSTSSSSPSRRSCIVHDLHPDYASTRYARRAGGARRACRLLAVQHHHAHMASCMAEHGLTEPVIGVTFDGTGYGTDGAIWGGEFLVGDYRSFRRAAHLRYVGMPGGDQAIREPWRMARRPPRRRRDRRCRC